MQIQTLLLLILAALVALAIVGFQYFYKNKRKSKTIVYLSFFRFLALFGLFVLLINPKLTKKEITIEKTNLVVLVDNSSSLVDSRNTIENSVQEITQNQKLQEKFTIQEYSFGESLKSLDSLKLQEKQTDISQALSAISEIYNTTNTAVVILTDGNQTVGQDYEFLGNKLKFPVYPVAIGDTTQYEDIAVNQVNSNKYVFLKNKFPLEFYINYQGQNNRSVPVSVAMNGQKVFSEQVQLSSTQKSKRMTTFLEANSIGVKTITINAAILSNEKNIKNNSKTIAVEVIDEKTNVGIVSSISHPDIGALKKAIETNEQRSVTILKPDNTTSDLDEIDIFILYQPDASFKAVYEFVKNKKTNVLVIEGPKTDLNFLNSIQTAFQIETGYPVQEVLPILNPSFSLYDIRDFKTTDFPPLLTKSGAVLVTENNQSLLQMQIRGVTLENPLFVISEVNGVKTALFNGEGIWKWRSQSFRNNRNFENFDQFVGKLLLYLSDNKKKNRLNVEHLSIYEGSSNAKLTATYFDETFVFDPTASLVLQVNNKEIPLLVKGNYYEIDLSDFEPGKYTFIVKVLNTNLTKSGTFEILDFDVEQQFYTTNYNKLGKLAEASGGKLFFSSQTGDLISEFNKNLGFLPVQKSNENVVSLIDFKILLALIIAALTAEWFIRKFNGLI